jgi:hypothetical protein
LAVFSQGEIMNKDTPEVVDSVLEVRAVGSLNAEKDLELEDGKSISEILDEQQKTAEQRD